MPSAAGLAPLSAGARARFDDVVVRLEKAGAEVTSIDIGPFLAAARLLYDTALVAERHAAVGAFVDAHPDDVDPVVGPIIRAGGDHSATDLAAAQAELDGLRVATTAALAGYDALVLPTAPVHPTLDEVAADPVGVNRHVGTYTNFLNLLDMAGVAMPAGTVPGEGSFGVTVAVRAFDDQVAVDIAALLTDEPAGPSLWTALDLVVFGAHMRGEPLNHQLTERGARFVGDVVTADAYRMYALHEPAQTGDRGGRTGRGGAAAGRALAPVARRAGDVPGRAARPHDARSHHAGRRLDPHRVPGPGVRRERGRARHHRVRRRQLAHPPRRPR